MAATSALKTVGPARFDTFFSLAAGKPSASPSAILSEDDTFFRAAMRPATSNFAILKTEPG